MTDDEFLRAFEAGTLPSSAFHHREHLRMVWLYLRQEGADGAARLAASGLQRFAAANGVPNLYHETLTRFWVRLVGHAMSAYPKVASFEQLLTAFPGLLDKNLPMRHYNHATLMSSGARAGWVEGDLLPLP